jgi:hypothetical protein
MMSDPIIPPSDPPDTPPAPPIARDVRGEVICGFCETRVTLRGEIIRLSTRAKELRDFEDDLEDLRKEIADRDATIAETRRDLDEARATIAALQPKVSKGLFGG